MARTAICRRSSWRRGPQAASLEAAVTYLAIDYCANIACVATPTQSCLNDAQSGGACKAEVEACVLGAP